MTEHARGSGPSGPDTSRPEPSGLSSDPDAGLTRRERREAREAREADTKDSPRASRGTGTRASNRAARDTDRDASRATRDASRATRDPARTAARAARTATRAPRAATPPRPAWQDAPTEETPVVDVGAGNGRGGGNGRDPARRRSWAVGVVIGVLTIPLLLVALVTVGPSVLSSGGSSSKPTPKTAGAGQVQLLLRPGLTVSQIGDAIAMLPGHTKAGFLAVAGSGQIRSAYEPATANSVEGLLFPDTYFVLPNESDASIMHRLVDRFDQIGGLIGLGGATAVSPYQTIIVASLIQQEVKVPTDGPLVAAVIYNRLKAGMPLQIDATLCYVKGGCPPVPTNADKARVSPYNTYKVTGLPPTPIASVTTASLQAAMQPANVPYVYYVIADSNGKLAFATTLAQQNHNIALARQKGLL